MRKYTTLVPIIYIIALLMNQLIAADKDGEREVYRPKTTSSTSSSTTKGSSTPKGSSK